MSNLLILGSTSGVVRTDTKDGKSYTVVPIVALVEGVIHAMNAKAPELVRSATYAPTPPLWNGRPVFLGHPLNEQGRPVSGAIPHVAKRSIGMVYNCGVKDDKLCMEAWLDERAPKELLDRVNGGDPVEVSVGVFVDTDDSAGDFAGRSYTGEWHNMVPDHLAILPAGDIGACSWAAGCGVRAASLRDAIGNGNNQYTHGQVAAAHEAARTAHETAQEAHKENAKNPSPASRQVAENATAAAMTASSKAEKTARQSGKHATEDQSAYKSAQYTSQHVDEGNHANNSKQAAQLHQLTASKHGDAAYYHNYQHNYDRGRNNAEGSTDEMTNMYAEWLAPGPETDRLLKTLRSIPQSERDKMSKDDFAGPNESFPISEPVDVHDAAQSIGRAKGDSVAIKAKIVAIAYRKGSTYVAQLPNDWKKKKDQKNGLLNTAFAVLREMFRTNDTSDSEVRSDLNEMLREQGMNGDVVDVYDDYFVYCLYAPDGMSYYRRDYTKDATGAVAGIGTDVTEVEPKRSYEPVAASTTQPEPKAACGCHQQKEKDLMDLKTRVKALITASKGVYEDTDATMLEGYKPERLTALEAKFAEAAVVKPVETPAAVAATPTAVVPPVKEPTFDELLAKADPDTRAAIDAGRNAAAAKKTATIATLKASKRCDYTDEQLNAMSQVDLDRLAKLASVTVATGVVDYSGQGAPRVGGERQGAPAPIELKDALAANKK